MSNNFLLSFFIVSCGFALTTMFIILGSFNIIINFLLMIVGSLCVSLLILRGCFQLYAWWNRRR